MPYPRQSHCVPTGIVVIALAFSSLPGQSFDFPQTTPTTIAPGPIAAADFDGDGIVDFATSDPASIAVVLSTCVDAYGTPAVYPTPSLLFSTLRGLAAGDLDGDGDADLVGVRAGAWPTLDAVVTVLQNQGDGTFAPAVDHVVIGSPTASAITPLDVAFADMDGDGRQDLAIASCMLSDPGQPGYFTVVLNQTAPGGPIALAPAANFVTRGDNSSAIVARDLDNDGDIDLATNNRSDNSVSVFLNDGSGFTGSVRRATITGTNAAPTRLACGDLNNDGYPDLIALNLFGHSYTKLMNLDGTTNTGRAGSFSDNGQFPIASQVTPALSLCTDFQLADLDDDGNQDLVATMYGDFGQPGFVSVLPGDGQGNLGAEVPLSIGPDCDRVAIVDLDGDGDLDLAATSFHDHTITTIANLRLARWRNLHHSLAGQFGPPCLRAFDFPTGPFDGGLRLSNTLPITAAFLVVGSNRWDVPLLGGLVVPDPTPPNGNAWFYATDAQGKLSFDFIWPPVSPGWVFYFQIWLLDAAGPQSFSATNALEGSVR